MPPVIIIPFPRGQTKSEREEKKAFLDTGIEISQKIDDLQTDANENASGKHQIAKAREIRKHLISEDKKANELIRNLEQRERDIGISAEFEAFLRDEVGKMRGRKDSANKVCELLNKSEGCGDKELTQIANEKDRWFDLSVKRRDKSNHPDHP